MAESWQIFLHLPSDSGKLAAELQEFLLGIRL